MTQDGLEAQTWADFEDCCDAVNQARASKLTTVNKVHISVFSAESLHRWKLPFWNAAGTIWEPLVSNNQGELTQEKSMTMKHIALQTSLTVDHQRRWKRALHHATKNYEGELHVGQSLGFWRRGASAAKKPKNAFWHPGVISNTLAVVWVAFCGSVVECARAQVRPFHDDDEAAQDNVTEHLKKLGERLLHDGRFSYGDITGQDETPVDRPLVQRRKDCDQTTRTQRRRTNGIGTRCTKTTTWKTRTVSTDQPIAPSSSVITDTARQGTDGDHDDKRGRVDEPETPLSPVVQNEPDLGTSKDEIVVDAPLPEEPEGMSNDQLQSWITEESLAHDRYGSARRSK